MSKRLTDKQLQDIQDRSRVAWNKNVQREEAEQRKAEQQAQARRDRMHVVRPGQED